MYKLRPVDSENTQLLPQQVKSCSISGFALLSIMERNHARFTFKRFFHPLPFVYALNRMMKEWREKSERKLRHSQIPLLIYHGKKDASLLNLWQRFFRVFPISPGVSLHSTLYNVYN